MADEDESKLMTPREVADLMRVHTKTVSRWTKDGKLTRILTPGGHVRLLRKEVQRLLDGEVDGSE